MDLPRRHLLPLLGAGLAAAQARAQYAPAPEGTAIRAHLGLTENPFGPSPAARRAIAESVAQAPFYPHSEAPLIARIAVAEGLTPDHVALASGSLDALSLLAVALGRGGRLLAPQPTYSTHLAYAARQGVETDWVPLARDHQIDLPALAAAIGPQTRAVNLCNPNNPTGLLLRPAALRAFAREVSARVPVLVDEAYYELVPDPAGTTAAPLVRDGHDVIVVRTFSKVYGLAGLRIGYVLARPDRVRLLKGLATTSRNQAGLAAAAASLGDAAYLAGARRYLTDCRARIYRIARDNGLRVLPSEGTFAYLDCGRPAVDVQARLLREGVEVRLFEGAAYANWMRIGTATPAELAYFGTTLPKALAS